MTEVVDDPRFLNDATTRRMAPSSSPSPAAVEPSFLSPVAGCEGGVGEFERGLEALRLPSINPQQWAIQQVADSRNEDGSIRYVIVCVEEPRRSGKSESVYGLAIGRCLERQGYRVALTFATTGTKAAQRFKNDIFDRLERWAGEAGVSLTPIKSNGHEGIKFGDTDSILMILPPKSEAFRSEAFDLIIIDEAGEASVPMGEDLLAGALPTMDTRDDAQIIVAGTPAKYRVGNLLWDARQAAIDGEPEQGAVVYGVPQELTLEDIETWELVEPLVEKHHPGIGTLTTLPKMARNYRLLGPERFAREYLGQYGRDEATAGIINPGKWNAGEIDGDLDGVLPDHFGVGMAVSFDQAWASLAVAWRVDGIAYGGLLERQPQSAWLVDDVNALATKFPRVPIGHDSKGPVMAQAEKITQARPRTRLDRQTWPEIQTAAALLVSDIHRGKFKHFGQESLTDAALVASRRGEEQSFAFGRPTQEAQIEALEALSIALRIYDEQPVRPKVVSITA